MISAFDADTAITDLGDGTYATRVNSRWSIGTVPNGGYSSSAMLRAMVAASGRPDPLSVTTHYYRPTVADTEATITTDLHREGRSFANVSAAMVQEGKERTRATAVLGELPRDNPAGTQPAVPVIAPPDQCVPRSSAGQGIPLPLMDMIDVRIDPAPEPLPGDPAALLRAWIRFTDERPPDPLALAMFVDAFPPAVTASHAKIGWVPTLELTLHLRRRPVAGWVAAEIRADDIAGNRLIEDVRLWDESGALVAQARQFAMLGQSQSL
ncbi:MAG: thioesterase family protein [Acidimicrobiales bacterium]